MNFLQRSAQQELLDNENIPFEDIKQNLKELNVINTYLGGHRINLLAIKNILQNKAQASIVEIGCGGGDNLAYLQKKLKGKFHFYGIDIKKECVDFASTKYQNIDFFCSDFNQYQFKEQADIIFSSLFCHHFSDKDLITQLQWMRKNSKLGFIINDLHRNKIAFYAIKILTQLFSKSYLVKNDAPLSVARAFTRKEWQRILQKAEISNYKIKWQWAFRFVIEVKN